MFGQPLLQPLGEAAPDIAQMIGVADGDRAGAIVPEQPQRAIEVGDLIRGRRQVPRGISESMRDRFAPRVPDRTDAETRLHSVTPKSPATAAPDCTASSWNPLRK